ncbi:MAG: methyltransferase [bacterium]|nr:methyltransferase [bacterium]
MNAINLINLARSYWESKVLFVSVRLKIFTILHTEDKSVSAIANILSLNPNSAKRFLDTLVSLKLLQKEGNFYKNTSFSNLYLVENKDSYLGNMVHHCESLWKCWEHLEESVKSGKPVAFKLFKNSSYKHRLKDYVYAMHDIGSVVADEIVSYLNISHYKNMLDLGGGSGAYSIILAKNNPNLKATIFELSDVLKHTKKFIQKAKTKNQISTIPGNFLEDSFGKEEYDLILISNLIHIYDATNNKEIINKTHRALAKKGKIVIHNLVLNNETTPKEATLFDLNMLMGTVSGRVYTQKEVKNWLKEIGFRNIKSYTTTLKTKVIIGVK